MNITYDNNDFPVNSGAIKKEMALFLLRNYLDIDSNSSRKYRQIAKNLGIKKLKKVNSKDWNADISREWTKAHTTALNQIQGLPIDELVSFTNKKLKSSGKKNIERLSTLKGRKLKIKELSDGDLLSTAFAEPEETEKSREKIKFSESQRKEYLEQIIKATKPTTKVDTTSAKYEKDEDGNKKLTAGTEKTITTKTFEFSEPTEEDSGKLKLLADNNVRGISLIRAGGNEQADTGDIKPLTQFNYLNRGNYSDRSKKEKIALAWDDKISSMDKRLTNKEAIDFLRSGIKETSFANKLIIQYIKSYKSGAEKILPFLSQRGTKQTQSRLQRVRNPLELKEKLYNLEFLFGKVYKTDDEEPKELETIDDSFDKLLEQYKEYNSFKDKNTSLKQKNMPRIISNMTVLLSKIKRNINQHSSELKEKLNSLLEVRESKEKKASTSSRDITKSTDAKKAFDNFKQWFSSKDGFFADLIDDTYHLYSFEIVVKKTITKETEQDEEDNTVIKTTPNYEFVSFKISETHEISRGSANTRVKSGKQTDEQGYYSKYSKRGYSPKSLYDLPSEEKQSLRYFVGSIQSGIEKLQNRLNN